MAPLNTTIDWYRDCAVVIPCYNEARTIADLVHSVRQHVDAVIVVDDGSDDTTAEQASASGAHLLRHSTNRGKGAALQTGLNYAAETLSKRWAVAMDGDGQHAAADIPSFFAAADRTHPDLVIGNRMGSACRMPFLRRWTNRLMSAALTRRAGIDIPDSQCGFRLIRLTVWKRLTFTTRRFELESEFLLQFLRDGRSIEFVPIQVIYKEEQSKIHPLADAVRWIRWWRRS